MDDTNSLNITQWFCIVIFSNSYFVANINSLNMTQQTIALRFNILGNGGLCQRD